MAIQSKDTPRIRTAIAALKTQALASGEMQNPITVDKSPDGNALRVDIPLAGSGTDNTMRVFAEAFRSSASISGDDAAKPFTVRRRMPSVALTWWRIPSE